MIKSQCNENGINKEPSKPDSNVEVIFGLIGKWTNLPIIDILIKVQKVINIHLPMLVIGVNHDEDRPNQSANQSYNAECQVESEVICSIIPFMKL